MVRPLRLEFSGALYSVTARGNERKSLARALKVDKETLTRGRRRTPARCWAMWLLEEFTGWKVPQAAKRMGVGDSSGVSQCIKSWRKQSETARQLRF
jgi:hypothetical protein